MSLDLSQHLGRVYDMVVWRPVVTAANKLQELLPVLLDETGEAQICTGLQKLAQKFLIVLHTEKGTVPYRPDFGTDFIPNLRSGKVRQEADLMSVFTLAEIDIREVLKSLETDDTPADEKYSAAVVKGTLVTPGYAMLKVELHSEDSQATYLLPISIDLIST